MSEGLVGLRPGTPGARLARHGSRPAQVGRWPWLLSDVLNAVGVNLIGLGLILGGLHGSRHTTDPHNMLLLLNVAAAGVIVALVGAALFLLTGLRNVGHLRTELLGAPRALMPEQSGPRHEPTTTGLVAAANMTHFHRAGCPAVTGKHTSEFSLADHLSAGRTPCGLCAPVNGKESPA